MVANRLGIFLLNVKMIRKVCAFHFTSKRFRVII